MNIYTDVENVYSFTSTKDLIMRLTDDDGVIS